MSLKKIAELSGVSVSTVSKVMHGNGEISESTVLKVKNAAKELGCLEKYYIGKYNKTVIAVILPEFGSEFYTRLASEIAECAEKHGAVTIFSQSSFNKEKCTEIADYLSFRGMADGIVLIGHSDLKQKLDIPSVVQGEVMGVPSDCINCNIAPAVFSAVDYLAGCGHKKIAYVGEQHTMSKLHLLKQALSKQGIPLKDEYTYISENRFMSAGFHGAQYILGLKNPPTAIIAAYDYIALGMIEYFKQNKINVPDDISVIGMDNIIAAEYGNLTSIAFDYKRMCEETVDLLFKRIENKYYTPTHSINYDAKLIIRNSVKNINKSI